MGLLEEAQAAGDGERNAADGEFHLDFQALEVGAVEHGHFLQRDALVAEFQHALGDKGGLGGGIRQGDERGPGAQRLAGRAQVFFEAAGIGADGGVGEIEDLGDAAVVGLDDVDLGARIPFRETEDERHVRAAPGVDRLRVVADGHQAVGFAGEQVDHAALDAVGVLILIDEHVSEAFLIELQHVGVLLEEADGEDEQVVEVHRVGGLLFLDVALADFFDFLGPVVELVVAGGDDFLEGGVGVFDEGEHRGEHVGLREAALFRIDIERADDGVEDGFLVVAIEDGERAGEAEVLGMAAEDARADRVEGAGPERGGVVRDEFADALGHLAGGLVGEGEQQDLAGVDAVVEQPGHAVGESAGFPGAGAGDDQRAAGRRGDGGVLLLVEGGLVVDAGGVRRSAAVEGVVSRHGGIVWSRERRVESAEWGKKCRVISK